MNKFQDKSFPKENYSSNDITEKNHKTTNVNILLNRVRLDKKRDFYKKLFFLSLLISVISIIVILTVV